MKRHSPKTANPYLIKRFDERAAEFAKKERLQADHAKTTYIKFELQKESYGIHFTDCTQVLTCHAISPIPFSHPCIKGVIHHDGAFIAIVDLLAFFGYSQIEYSTDQFVIMIHHAIGSFGFLVNSVIGRDAYSKGQLMESLPESFAENKKYMLGIHHGKTAILNIDEIAKIFFSSNEIKKLSR